MKVRTAIVVAVALGATTLTGTATAAVKKPKPVCNLLTDAKGDESPAPDAALDVVSADLASDTKKITGVIRLSASPSGQDPFAPTGRTYHLSFVGQGGENPVFFTYIAAPNATAAKYGRFNPDTGINEGLGAATFKVVGSAIYMTAPVGVFSPYGKFKSGAKITDLQVMNGRMAGAFVDDGNYAYNTVVADTGTGTKTYTAGAKSCVKVGG